MYSVGVNVIETAALGRPFQLGMLYDCRKDALIPGITLWNKEQLQDSTRARPQINTVYKVTASDSTEEKINVLNIDGRLELSLLGGLVNVNGAAKYLNDTKKSFKQQRLTLLYHSTSKFEELTMNHLAPGNISHHGVFENDAATHVVTAVLYGADAFFVFDREVSSDENENTVAGEVKAAFDKLKGTPLDANINLSMIDKQKIDFQKFSCTFYGDFRLPSNPTTFEDALKVYDKLPKLLGEKKDLVVPLRVWLYPLDKLHTGAAKLQKDISISLIKDIESVIESLSTAEMKCSDLLSDTVTLSFAPFQSKIQQMRQNCHNYKLSVIEKLGSLLPKIRGDQEKEAALIDLLRDHGESPFNRSDLEQWLEEKEKESDIIKTLLRQLNDSGAEVEVNMDKSLMDLNVENLVCFTFTSLEWSDVLLSKQKVYVSPSTKGKNYECIPVLKQKTWLTSDIKKSLRSNLSIFKSLIDFKDCKPAKFIVTSKEMEDHPGSCILLYENGCDEAVCFSSPSKPASPIIEQIRDDGVVLKVPLSCPNTVELRLLYKTKEEKDWKSHTVLQSQDTVTLTDLRTDIQYEIKCAAVGKLNYIVDSDVTRHYQMAECDGGNIIRLDELREIEETLSTQDLPTTRTDCKSYCKEQDPVKMNNAEIELNDCFEDFTEEELEELKNVNNSPSAIKAYLTQQEVNIAVTGESGSGKSSFVNAFRGVGDEEEGAAQTGPVETTMQSQVYIHPKYKNVKVWDLPGIGTPNFKAKKYLKQVQFERYDFFIIIASDRFRECHTQLAKEIKRMGKKFYFVRSKIDSNIYAEKRKKNFDLKKTMDTIREDCEKGLRKNGIDFPVVFLMSGWELGKYDLNLMQERLEKELPQHKRHVLMLALPNITLEINKKKKKALEENISRVALLSACVAAIPLPGLSIVANVAIIADELRKYYSAFGLDDPSLQKLCERSGKTVEDLKGLMKSPLHNGINPSSVRAWLAAASLLVSEDAIVGILSLIPIVGTVVAAGLSYSTVSRMLKKALDEIAEDATKVLMAFLESEM